MLRLKSLLSIVGLACTAAPAFAHVGVDGPGIANANQVLTFSVGHGCEGADTIRIAVHIPPEITALRALPGPFGEPEILTSSAGLPLSVIWSKNTSRAADDQYYRFSIRTRIPNTPFTTLYFKTTQVCRDDLGNEVTVEWEALPGEEGEPAAPLLILPQKRRGWNKISVSAALDDLTIFDDAEIVWLGESAYSGNPTTKDLITAEPSITPLSAIPAGSEIWVKY